MEFKPNNIFDNETNEKIKIMAENIKMTIEQYFCYEDYIMMISCFLNNGYAYSIQDKTIKRLRYPTTESDDLKSLAEDLFILYDTYGDKYASK